MSPPISMRACTPQRRWRLSARGLALIAGGCVVTASLGALVAAKESLHVLEEDFRAHEVESILDAIQAGPLKFATRHSAHYAQSELESLFVNGRLATRGIVEAALRSGPDGRSMYASWAEKSSLATEGSCIARHTRRITPNQAVYPFYIDVALDTCKVLSLPTLMAQRLFLLIGILAAVAGIAILIAVTPIVISIRQASVLLNANSSMPRKSAGVDEIMFNPLRELTMLALEGRRAAIDKAIAMAMRKLAHDVRKPLTYMRISLSMFERCKTMNEVTETSVKVRNAFEKTASGLEAMLRELLDSGATSRLDPSSTRIEDLIGEVIDEQEQPAAARNLTIRMEFHHTHRAWIDRTKIARAIGNIVSNGIEAANTGGSLWVTTHDAIVGGRACIRIAIGNTGSFIAPENQSRIFEPYFTTGKKNGTGLGLAIVKQFVEVNGGDVTCTSDRERGTEFTIDLPACLPGHKEDKSDDSTRFEATRARLRLNLRSSTEFCREP